MGEGRRCLLQITSSFPGVGEDPGGRLRGTDRKIPHFWGGGDVETAIKLHIEHSFGNSVEVTPFGACVCFLLLSSKVPDSYPLLLSSG